MIERKLGRKNFGPGLAGKSAFELLKSKALCENCGDESIHALDFDIFGALEQISVCGRCIPHVKKKVEKDLMKIGREPSFGIDGWGRA